MPWLGLGKAEIKIAADKLGSRSLCPTCQTELELPPCIRSALLQHTSVSCVCQSHQVRHSDHNLLDCVCWGWGALEGLDSSRNLPGRTSQKNSTRGIFTCQLEPCSAVHTYYVTCCTIQRPFHTLVIAEFRKDAKETYKDHGTTSSTSRYDVTATHERNDFVSIVLLTGVEQEPCKCLNINYFSMPNVGWLMSHHLPAPADPRDKWKQECQQHAGRHRSLLHQLHDDTRFNAIWLPVGQLDGPIIVSVRHEQYLALRNCVKDGRELWSIICLGVSGQSGM